MRYRLLFVSIAGLSILCGAPACSHASPQQPASGTRPEHPTGTLTTAKPAYAKGDAIEFTFTIDNATSSTVHYEFSTGQQFDVDVTDPHGVEIWKWSADRVFTQQLTSIDLKPGDHKTYTAEWNTSGVKFLPTGLYSATATITPTIRPAVRGGLLIETERDPDNMGRPTMGSTESGDVIEVNVTNKVAALAKFSIGGMPVAAK